MYKLIIKKQAEKALKRIPRADVNRILQKLDMLAENPNRQDLNIILLTNQIKYRLRVGKYRIIFERDDEIRILLVEKIGHRKDIYTK